MKTVLVVEDDRAIRTLVVEILEREGYRVVTADNGRHGLEQLLLRQPDLVVSDLMMPVLTGIEMAKAIRADPRYQQIPLIGISGVMQPDALTLQLFTTFLAKPFHIADLVARIAKYLGDTP